MVNRKMEEFEIETKASRRMGRQTFSEFLYDGETGSILGRTPERWVKLIIFYAIFWACLIALFAVCMTTFLQHFINPRVPRLQQEYSVIGNSPGLGFRPLPPDVRSTLIWYKGTGYDSYKYWEDQLINFLSVYKKKGQTAGAGQNIFNCDFKNLPPPGKVCDVDIRGLEPCIEENHFSFHKSSPCIFLKLNRIYGWRPEFYNDTNDLPQEMPVDLQSHIRNITYFNRDYANMVWVSCHGETPADKENIGPVRYLPHPGFPGYFYPYNNAEGYLSPLVAVHLMRPRRYGQRYSPPYKPAMRVSCHGETPADKENIGPVRYLPHPGFPGYFYPYNNAEGYLSPLVAVHLMRPRTGIVINIECRAWARNIKYDRRERLGVVHFELMIE